jgi:hypothetical protein
MSSKKLKLSELKVKSFVTLHQDESEKVKAGFVKTDGCPLTFVPEICTDNPHIGCI